MRLDDVIAAINGDPFLDEVEKIACGHVARILVRSAKGRRHFDHLPLGPLEQRRMARLLACITIALDVANRRSPGFFELVETP